MRLGPKREAVIHFNLHRAISNVISRSRRFGEIEFGRTEPEYPVPGIGKADLVLFDIKGTPWLTIETKAATKAGDPFSDKVIAQATGYAAALGSYYFGTCDGRTFVLFDNKERGVPFWERKRLPPYDITSKDLEAFAQTLLRDISQLEAGTRRWSALDEAFVVRLKYLHQRLVPYVLRSLNGKMKEDKFRRDYERWVKKQGFEPETTTFQKTAAEAAYLLINKVLFYKVLEPYYNLPKLKRITETTDVSHALQKMFRKVLDIDYEAVFEPSMYDLIPLPKELAEVMNDFLEEAAHYDLSKIESDVLGRIYEGLIPTEERRVLGQYYTPPPICDLIVRMCISREADLVLDPACGSGGFLVKAYYRLAELMAKGKVDDEVHRRILHQLYGVDISHFPAHLAVINLALRNIAAKSDVVNVIPRDFFKVLPKQQTLLPILKRSIGEATGTIELVPQFDAIVCNPPYTRQDEIGDERYRDYIRRVALAPDGKLDISREAGIYAYFFTHSAHFLREDGMMGYIVSNSWMDVKFGVAIQRFFLDHFRIHSIIEFDRRAFEEAAINTVLVILQKTVGEKRQRERDENVVRFVRVKRPLTPEVIVRRIGESHASADRDDIRITCVRQGDLYDDAKWLKYLRAPPIYFAIRKHPKVVPLSHVADINVGIITYANSFFILTKDAARNARIEKRFLRPIVTSPRDVNFLDLRTSEVSEVLFYCNDPKARLQGTHALNYINWGESARVEITRGAARGTFVKGYHRIPSFRGKQLWYAVGDRQPAAILVPRLMWERLFVIRNDAQALANDRFYEVRPKDDGYEKPLLAYLNSVLGRLSMEVCGRTTLGEGGLELMKYELYDFPVLDPARLNEADRARLAKAYDTLERRVREGAASGMIEVASRDLDLAVFQALSLTDEQAEAVRAGYVELQSLRKGRVEVDVLVDHPERRPRGMRGTRQHRVAEFDKAARSLDDFAS